MTIQAIPAKTKTRMEPQPKSESDVVLEEDEGLKSPSSSGIHAVGALDHTYIYGGVGGLIAGDGGVGDGVDANTELAVVGLFD